MFAREVEERGGGGEIRFDEMSCKLIEILLFVQLIIFSHIIIIIIICLIKYNISPCISYSDFGVLPTRE